MVEYYLEDVLMGEKIFVRAVKLDEGMQVLIAGGEKSHIGAISYARPDEPIETIQFPGHKEGIISSTYARTLSERLKETVCAECGIHYDNLKKEQIEQVVKVCQKLLDQLTESMKKDWN